MRYFLLFLILSCGGAIQNKNFKKNLQIESSCLTELSAKEEIFQKILDLEENYLKFLNSHGIKEFEIPVRVTIDDYTIFHPLMITPSDFAVSFDELKNDSIMDMGCLWDNSLECNRLDSILIRVKELISFAHRYRFAYCNNSNGEKSSHDIRNIAYNYEKSKDEIFPYLKKELTIGDFDYFFTLQKGNRTFRCLKIGDEYLFRIGYRSYRDLNSELLQVEEIWSDDHIRFEFIDMNNGIDFGTTLNIYENDTRSSNYAYEDTIFLKKDRNSNSLAISLAHELGHFLGFPDCYLEFVENDHYIYYEIDKNNLMCSFWGEVLPNHREQLIKNYCL